VFEFEVKELGETNYVLRWMWEAASNKWNNVNWSPGVQDYWTVSEFNAITMVWLSLCLLGGSAGNCDRSSDWFVAKLVPQLPVRVAVERGPGGRLVMGSGQVVTLLCLPV